MSDELAQHAKPGTACLACRSRKLKCSRGESGCTNCLKADLPCVYPQQEIGVKRKRGPYKKDKPPRERHLEDLVKYLEPKVGRAPLDETSASTATGGWPRRVSNDSRTADSSPSNDGGVANHPVGSSSYGHLDDNNPKSSEALVKDALVALTKASVSDREAYGEQRRNFPRHDGSAASQQPPERLGLHPPPRIIFEYWHIFVTRADPLLKLVHAPSLAKRLFEVVDKIQEADGNLQTLMFGVYYTAICACTVREVWERFGESRYALMRRYGRTIEANLSDNYNVPTLGSLQGLILYLKSVQRAETETSLRALFSLAVRMSQLIGIQEDPGDSFNVYEAEMRRRAWWHVCGLESRGAEESGARTTTIMADQHVQFPANFNDSDIWPDMSRRPEPRAGPSELTYPLLRWEMVQLNYQLWSARRQGPQSPATTVQDEQRKRLREAQNKINERYIRYLHPSRIYDWMCINFADILMTKYRLMIDYPVSQVPSADMTPAQRLDLLESSVKIIHTTYMAANDACMSSWAWFYRSWFQWHSLAIVIVELTRSTNQRFANSAWTVLDPILADWDRMYRAKKGEPAWEHVHAVIERARQMRNHGREQWPSGSVYSTPMTSASSSVNQSAHKNMLHAQRQQPSPSPSTPNNNPTSPDPRLPFHVQQRQQQQQQQQQYQHQQYQHPQQNVHQQTHPGLAMPYTIPISSPSIYPDLSTTAPPPPGSSDPNLIPNMQGIAEDISNWSDGMGDVDLSAFDAVFGDTAWTFPDMNAGFDLASLGAMT